VYPEGDRAGLATLPEFLDESFDGLLLVAQEFVLLFDRRRQRRELVLDGLDVRRVDGPSAVISVV